MALISVVMSVYNTESFLKEAVESILNQTLQDFEFIIINDASTDNSLSIINSFNDSRIKIINNQENIGLTKSLNKGMRVAKGKFIARMDADDISLPERLQEQYKFMEKNPAIGACGSWYQFIPSGELVTLPVTHEQIVKSFLRINPIAHPVAFIRTSVLMANNLFYNESIKYAQDYELWLRFCKVSELANIPKILLQYRHHAGQISIDKLEQQNYYKNIVLFNAIYHSLNLTHTELQILTEIKEKKQVTANGDVNTLIEKIINHPAEILSNREKKQYIRTLLYSYLLTFKNSPFKKIFLQQISIIQKIKLYLKTQ